MRFIGLLAASCIVIGFASCAAEPSSSVTTASPEKGEQGSKVAGAIHESASAPLKMGLASNDSAQPEGAMNLLSAGAMQTRFPALANSSGGESIGSSLSGITEAEASLNRVVAQDAFDDVKTSLSGTHGALTSAGRLESLRSAVGPGERQGGLSAASVSASRESAKADAQRTSEDDVLEKVAI